MRRWWVAGAIFACAVALGACAQSDTPSSLVSAPTPTATSWSESEAFDAAEATYRAYVDALNAVDLQDPETFEAVYAWTTGDANVNERESLSQMHAEGLSVTGQAFARVLAVGASAGNPSTYEVLVCIDVSAVEVVNASNESLVDPGRSDVQPMALVLVRTERTETGLWISEFAGRDGEPACA